MPMDFIDEKSILVMVMAYSMLYGIIRPQWVNYQSDVHNISWDFIGHLRWFYTVNERFNKIIEC